jgi:hypothetical protein
MSKNHDAKKRPQPKRHHWWPMAHSCHWVNEDGFITTIHKTGPPFLGRPENVGLQGHHNTLRTPAGEINTDLEKYFEREIDNNVAPVLKALDAAPVQIIPGKHILNLETLQREKKHIREQGFRIPKNFNFVQISDGQKRHLARYIASMMVRVPTYKDELHSPRLLREMSDSLGVEAKDISYDLDVAHIDLLKRHLDQYSAKLIRFDWLVFEPDTTDELLIGDAPVIVREFCGGDALLYFSLTPRRGLMVVDRWKGPIQGGVQIIKVRRKFLNWYNRMVVMNAERAVFCRRPPLIAFVQRHLGTRQLRIGPKIDMIPSELAIAEAGEAPLLKSP